MNKKIHNFISVIKLFLAFFILKIFRRELYKKDIWIVNEKGSEARDNGYVFFKFLKDNHPEINSYYVITNNSPDRYKIKKYNNIITLNSFKHYIYYLAAKFSISSQPYGAAPIPTALMHKFHYLRKKQKVIFLQHGIIKDELSHNLDYKKTNFDIFTTSTSKEYDFIKETYGYPKHSVQLLGLCRYDNLHNIEEKIKKQILIMPTFRSWLVSKDRTNYATQYEMEKFQKSDYYKSYSNLLSNKKLNALLEKYDYRVVFYPHYSCQSYIKCFENLKNNNIIIADRNEYDVQQLLIESNIMITDFSSVLFDFAYMKKPEIYFQFDEEQFRKSHYKQGYFDYSKDGFGPVTETVDEVIDEIEKICENKAKISDFYLNRINDFFDLHDNKNCERTYNAIINLK